MKMWLCKWPDGTRTFVHAKSRTHARELLHHVGDVDSEDWIEEYRGPFMADFGTEDDGDPTEGAHWRGTDNCDLPDEMFEAMGDPDRVHNEKVRS